MAESTDAKPIGEILKVMPRPAAEQRFIEKECRACFKLFTVPLNSSTLYRKTCDECERRELAETKHSLMKTLIPKAFLSTKVPLLPMPEKLREILAWSYSPIGLILHGSTGSGKSRCAWELIKREFMHHSFAALDSSAAIHYAAKFSIAPEDVLAWLLKLSTEPILLLDDVFKNKMTDSFEGFLFSVIDQRAQNELPTITTCNDTGASLTARLSGDRGEPLLRRLRETAQTISFERSKTSITRT